MKTLFSLLTIFACTALASAQGAETALGAHFYFGAGYSTSYTYNKNGTTIEEVCAEPLVENEIFRVLLVRDSRVDVTTTTEPSVVIDAAGQVVKKNEYALGFAWQPLQVGAEHETYITVGTNKGIPGQAYGGGLYGFPMYMPDTVPGEGGYIYCYLVALDTRKGTGDCEGLPSHVGRYAMSLCPYGDGLAPFPEEERQPRRFVVNGGSGSSAGGYQNLNYPGYDLAWQPAAAISSLVVNGETLTGEALKAALTPNVTAVTTSDEGLEIAASLTDGAPDVMYYTLYTKAALSETTWTPFEEFVKESEKFVDKTIGKSYTRFRISGESLSIPLVDGEASRFYMLRGE